MRVRDYIDNIELRDGETKRVNCPMCGGRNTFTCSRQLGKVIYNCYKASCALSGAYVKDRSASEIKAMLNAYAGVQEEKPWELPATLVSGKHNLSVQQYAKSVNAENAELMYDPEEHRAVFVIRDTDTHKPVGAVGRALNKNMMPKWKRYDTRRDLLYIAGDTQDAVVVEDCASASAVASAGFTGVALLGTNISAEMIPKLRTFAKVTIALDKDASRKAIKLKKTLEPYTQCSVRFLPDDLKYYSPDRIKTILSLS
jgi:hypothetical protein